MGGVRTGRLKEKDMGGKGLCQEEGQHPKVKGGNVCMLVEELERPKMVEKGSEQCGETAGPGHSRPNSVFWNVSQAGFQDLRYDFKSPVWLLCQ